MFRFVLFVAFVATIYGASTAKVKLYSDKYDYINAEEILPNAHLQRQYYDCFMDTGPCVTADAVFFKGLLPEVLVTKCLKCTERQKKMLATVAEWYAKNKPEQWKALISKLLEDAKKMNISAESA